jgi:PAS domain S-box-containing protein/putative nucleotidyltransferase with HDIG domain
MAQSNPIRILYIEDDPGLARLVQKRLGRAGYTVDIASDGAEGIAKYEADSYDVVFVDQSLPIHDGLEVIRILGSNGTLPPTIMITGTGDERVAVEAMKLGAGDYIIKDVGTKYLELLPSSVKKVLQQRRAIEEKQQAEEALRRSEEKYRTVLEEMEEGYFETDFAGNLTFLNDAGCRNLGYPREELIGKNNRQYTDAANAKKVLEAFNELYRTGKPCRVSDYETIKKDGTKAIKELSVSLMRDQEGKPIGFRGISRDITERKRAEERLRQSEERYRTIIETMQEGYFEADLKGRYTFANDALCRRQGYSKDELIGMSNREFQDQTNAKKSYQAFHEVYKTGKPLKLLEMDVIRKDGTKGISEVSVSLIRDVQGKPIGFRGISRDVTERKRAEEAYHAVVEKSLQGLHILQGGRAVFVNSACAKMLGYPKDELLALSTAQIRNLVHPEDQELAWGNYHDRMEEKAVPQSHEFRVIRKDGSMRWVEAFTSHIEYRGRPALQVAMIDITERKQAENALGESEERFRQFFENEPEYCYMISPEGIIFDVNNAALRSLGYTKEELIGEPLEIIYSPESLPKAKELFAQWKKTGSIKDQEILIITKDGTRRTVLLSAGAVRDKDEKILYGMSVQRDITEHESTKEALQRTEEHLRAILEGASDGFLYMDKEGAILVTNARMKEILADPHPEGKPLSAFYDEKNQKILAQNLKARWEGKGTVYEIVLTDKAGRQRNLLISGTPYRDKQGAIQGAFGIYHDVTHEREAAKILSEHKEALKNSFFGTTEALSKVIEDRDPYTSGHSTGVAGLAEAIARTMGLPEDRITGIYIAGVLHDIGKMAVPVEILVKPGRLSDMEMSLIQVHPQAGYEILKGIEFPWPVAQAALQHHERMDGSGYPKGLKGDEIILEARILAVADVVDAMTHHRPYRPAFSRWDALEEIKKGRGRIYDSQVVDACVEVLGGKEPFVISEYSTTSTSPQFRRGSKNSSTLPTTTRMRASGRR